LPKQKTLCKLVSHVFINIKEFQKFVKIIPVLVLCRKAKIEIDF